MAQQMITDKNAEIKQFQMWMDVPKYIPNQNKDKQDIRY
jgi:hypothetical protein